MPVAWGLGDNLARIRKARNLSQEELAQAAGLAVDTIARIERGERQTTRARTLHNLATALHVSASALLGVPPPEPAGVDADLADLRRAVTATTEVPGLVDLTEPRDTVGVRELRASLRHVWRAYLGGRDAELVHSLPALLSDARRAVHATADDERPPAQAVLSGAYRVAAGAAGRYGCHDLAFIAAERALRAARESDDVEVGVAVSTRYLVWVLVRQGRTDEAEDVAVRMAERVEPRFGDRGTRTLGVFGNLLFNAASAALRGGRPDRAADLLRVAGAAAMRSGRDEVGESGVFGPHVAAIQDIERAAHSGDPELALRLADDLPPPNGPVPAFWAAGHRIHLAAAAVELRLERRALGLLGQARSLAPDWVHHQPLGVTTMRVLVDRATRRRNAEFADLAAHFGVVA